MRRSPSIVSARTLDEVQVALFDLGAARDYAVDGGEPNIVGNRRDAALERIRATMENLCRDAQGLLFSLGEAEEGPYDPIKQIRERAMCMWELVRPGGGLDHLLDRLEDMRDFTGKHGAGEIRSARADLMEVRMHLHEVHRNYKRIVGFPLSA